LSTGSNGTYGIITSIGNGTFGKNLIYNNFVWNLNITTSGTGSVQGIYLTESNSAAPDTVAFNTVYLSGTSSGVRTSTGFYKASSTGGAVVKNNIFINTRTDGSTGIASAIGKTSASTSLISDNNNLFVGTSDIQHKIGRFGTTTYYLSLADWSVGNSSDYLSISENSPFVASNDLHIKNNESTKLESGGVPIKGITIDYDGEVRNTATPDIGADEFNGISTSSNDPEKNFAAANNFELNQNYPNPFNPETNISFFTPSSGRTVVKVLDILGKEIRILLDGNLNAGNHKLKFDGEGIATGIYFLQVEFESQKLIKKMILLK